MRTPRLGEERAFVAERAGLTAAEVAAEAGLTLREAREHLRLLEEHGFMRVDRTALPTLYVSIYPGQPDDAAVLEVIRSTPAAPWERPI